MPEIVQFIYLFFQLIIFVSLVIILINIHTKSYKPHGASIFTAIIMILFIMNGVFATISVRTLTNFVTNQVKQIAPTSDPNKNKENTQKF